MILSTHFTLQEATHSQTAERLGIKNSPSILTLDNMRRTAQGMEAVRSTLHDVPITVSSWLRVLQLNRVIGSKDSSQHIRGEAVDFIAPKFGDPVAICKALIKSDVDFDQLILEHTWVHISFSTKPRKVVLSLLENGFYANGLTNKHGAIYNV